MTRYFISDVYCNASLVTMAQMLLGGVRDTYKHAIINEDDIPVMINWLEKRQADIMEKNKRLKSVKIVSCKPYKDDTHRYINIGEGGITLIRVNERIITNKQ